MSCAYLIKKNFPQLNVKIFAEKFSPDTTSNIAAGLWRAANVGNTPREKLNKWSKGSFNYAVDVLSHDPDASEKGFSFQHGYLLSRKPINDAWHHLAISAVFMNEESVRKRFPHINPDIKYGLSYTSISLEPTKFLPYLLKSIQDAGGEVIQQKVTSLAELSKDFDIIINCSGLGARQLVNDEKVFPVRGQILWVKAPWIKEFVYDIDFNEDESCPYIIPNIDHVIIGGTKQLNDTNQLPVEKDRNFILESTKKLIPSLKHAEVIKELVGFRPGRDEVRLEAEEMFFPIDHGGKDKKKLTVIHNYGHMANGITLSWGCALEVIELLSNCF